MLTEIDENDGDFSTLVWIVGLDNWNTGLCTIKKYPDTKSRRKDWKEMLIGPISTDETANRGVRLNPFIPNPHLGLSGPYLSVLCRFRILAEGRGKELPLARPTTATHSY